MRFENKGVLITGATGGIGRETCFHFAEEGAAVAVTDLDLDLAESVAAEIRGKGGYSLRIRVRCNQPTAN
jgi:NAD(P)-dependent dehydrogenase (short-subunit alcohol dehydrogenase family)